MRAFFLNECVKKVFFNSDKWWHLLYSTVITFSLTWPKAPHATPTCTAKLKFAATTYIFDRTWTRKLFGLQKTDFQNTSNPCVDARAPSKCIYDCIATWQGSQKGRVQTPGVIAQHWMTAGKASFVDSGRGRSEIHLHRVCTSGCVWKFESVQQLSGLPFWGEVTG